MKFDYRFFEGQFLPIIPIKMKGKEGWMATKAYVDTGASYSLFHTDVAEILGINLYDGILHEVTVGDGNTLKLYLHEVLVSVAGEEFVAKIGFSKGLGSGFDIIGRKSIFDKFIVCFDEKDKIMEFIPKQK